MATRFSHRRTLPDPGQQVSKPISDPTGKRHPKSSTTTTTTTAAATSAVYNLTNHFSKLYPNPKPTKSQNPPPKKLVDTHLQGKALSKSAHFESSTLKPGKQVKRVVLGSDSNKSLVVVGERKGIVKKVEREYSKEDRENGVMMKLASTKMVGGLMGKRRSFCDAQMELANFLLTNCAKVVSADMPPFMQIHAVGFARKTKDSLEKFTSKSLALSLKREFDGIYGPAWHCVVGTSFWVFCDSLCWWLSIFCFGSKVVYSLL